MPQMAESISEGTLKTWQKKVGDTVAADEEVATIETDKVSIVPQTSPMTSAHFLLPSPLHLPPVVRNLIFLFLIHSCLCRSRSSERGEHLKLTMNPSVHHYPP